MQSDPIVFTVFLIFTGAAILAALALYARQSLLVAYIVLGVVAGPWGLKLVSDSSTVQQIGHVGIIFLLFLLGLNLHPQKLLSMMREATLVTLASSTFFAVLGGVVAWTLGFGLQDSVLIGAVMMFSSTIIALKLLPATELHHRHMGEVIISVLLLQDLIAIILLLLLEGLGRREMPWIELGMLVLALPGLMGFAYLAERFVLMPVLRRFDTIREYLFLAALGWCLGLAQLAQVLGLSYEIGAFVAGVALATSPISFYIAESLRPLRDFFLIMFFFSLGAGFQLPMMGQILLPSLVLAAVMLLAKPLVFHALLVRSGEPRPFSWEVGNRLGQLSEFSLLIAVLALETGAMGEQASYVVQAAAVFTFMVSSYAVVLRFPTPIAVVDRLRRD